jgi:hypothetical protein
VKVINYLLAAYIDPVVDLEQLKMMGIISAHPPQSIYQIAPEKLGALLGRIDLGFTP